MQLKLTQLIQNTILSSSLYTNYPSKYIYSIYGNLTIPCFENKPFILSCFALSTDGKLCYPDNPSGFAIAAANDAATNLERYADWWCLSLARSISDGVIIGSNSLLIENGEYIAKINIPELIQFRTEIDKPSQLLHIIICRDTEKIDWLKQAIIQDNNTPVVIYTLNITETLPQTLVSTTSYNKNLLKQVIKLEQINLPKIIAELYSCGIKTILNEAPYFHHQLLQHQLLDEAWLNTSGVHIGGNVASLGSNTQAFTSYNHPSLTILTMHHIGYNFLYTRYKVSYATN